VVTVGNRESLDVSVQEQIDKYIANLDPPRREANQDLHRLILNLSPNCRLWFLDGRNSENKVVTNENIGYGSQTLKYANGESKEFYRIGLSSNTSGISIYVIGLDDKKYLSETYGDKIGKAKITGYCVRFRHIRDVNVGVLEEIFANHLDIRSAGGS
jgi:hypothetical protein